MCESSNLYQLEKSFLSAPHLLAVGCANMVSLCDIGSRGSCVGLLWAVYSKRPV